MLTKVPDDGVVGIVVVVIVVLLIVLLVDAVVVCPVVVVSVTVDDVGCGDCMVVVTVVGSVTDSVQTYVAYTPCKCSISFLQGLFVFPLLRRMIFILPLKHHRCPEFCLFTIIYLKADNRKRK